MFRAKKWCLRSYAKLSWVTNLLHYKIHFTHLCRYYILWYPYVTYDDDGSAVVCPA